MPPPIAAEPLKPRHDGLPALAVDCALALALALALAACTTPAASVSQGGDAPDAAVAAADASAADASAADASAADAIDPDASAADASAADAIDPDDSATDANDPDASDPGADASDTDDASDATSDAGPTEDPPIVVVPGPPVVASVTSLHPGPWQQAYPLVGAEVLAYRPDAKGKADVALLGPLAGQVTAHQASFAAPVAAVAVGQARLLRHEGGVAALVGKTWLPSPLATALPGPVTAWRPALAGAGLWVVAGETLHLWRDGKLGVVAVPGGVAGAVALADGCTGGDGASAWVGTAKGLTSLYVAADATTTAKTWVADRAFASLVCAGDGVLWAASAGELISRGVDGSFVTWALGETVTAVVGADGAQGLWVFTDASAWHVDPPSFRRVLQLPPVAAWRVDQAGNLVGVAQGTVVRAGVVPPPPQPKVKWQQDIFPIYQARCALCHGPDGVSTKLHSATKWKDLFATILQYVEAGVMPLPPKKPLTSAEIATLKAWQAGGYLP